MQLVALQLAACGQQKTPRNGGFLQYNVEPSFALKTALQ